MKLVEILAYAKDKLNIAGDLDYDINARLLLEHCFNIDRTKYFLKYDSLVSDDKFEEFDSLLDRRLKNEPVQYITNKAYFMGHEFYVDKNVLIPRFDTEILVDAVLKHIKPGMKLLDMCTGSGCILLSILHEVNIEAVGADISSDALAVAKINADSLGLSTRLIKSDLFENINDSFDIIVSNPPYITHEQMKFLEKQVAYFEPRLALEAKDNGLYFYKEIIKNKKYLNNNGMIFFEVGHTQAAIVSDMLENAGFRDIHSLKDLNDIYRVVYARKE